MYKNDQNKACFHSHTNSGANNPQFIFVPCELNTLEIIFTSIRCATSFEYSFILVVMDLLAYPVNPAPPALHSHTGTAASSSADENEL